MASDVGAAANRRAGMIFLGIDPGLNGALAFYQPALRELDVIDMPTLALKRGKKLRREINAIELARLLDIQCSRVTLAVIEQAQTIPGTAGIMQAFQCGQNFGIAYGALAAQFVVIETVAPALWKREMACPKAKDGARARASQLLPEHAHYWARVKDDGRAEASLLALYAQRTHLGRLGVAA
jgi:crossover junction endodeoxyribonuclease RuvC